MQTDHCKSHYAPFKMSVEPAHKRMLPSHKLKRFRRRRSAVDLAKTSRALSRSETRRLSAKAAHVTPNLAMSWMFLRPSAALPPAPSQDQLMRQIAKHRKHPTSSGNTSPTSLLTCICSLTKKTNPSLALLLETTVDEVWHAVSSYPFWVG